MISAVTQAQAFTAYTLMYIRQMKKCCWKPPSVECVQLFVHGLALYSEDNLFSFVSEHLIHFYMRQSNEKEGRQSQIDLATIYCHYLKIYLKKCTLVVSSYLTARARA